MCNMFGGGEIRGIYLVMNMFTLIFVGKGSGLLCQSVFRVRASSILPWQSGPPPDFGGADLGVDLQKINLQLKRPQPGRHHCLKMLSIMTANAPQIYTS